MQMHSENENNSNSMSANLEDIRLELLALLNDAPGNSKRALFVTGTPETGKSKLIREAIAGIDVLRTHAGSSKRPAWPVARAFVSPNASPKSLALDILTAMGEPTSERLSVSEVSTRLRIELRRRRVRLVYLDEAHHLAYSAGTRGASKVGDFIKSMLWDPEHPIRLVCSGYATLDHLLDNDSQLNFVTERIRL